jgi:integrase
MSTHKKPNGRWAVRYRDDSGRNRSKTFTLKRDADSFDRKVKERRERAEIINPDLGNTTVGEFFDALFMPSKVGTESSKVHWRFVWARWVEPHFAKAPLIRANSRESVIRWQASMERDGASASAKHQAYSLLLSILIFAEELEYVSRVRIRRMHPEYKPKRAAAPWEPEDIERLRAAIRTDDRWRDERDRTAISLMGYQPLRLGEVFALDWQHILEGNGIGPFVHVRGRVPVVKGDREDRTKTNVDRLIRLEDATLRDLREWWLFNGRPRKGYVFPWTAAGDGLDYKRMIGWRNRRWYPAVTAAKLDRREPKHLRHTAISLWIRDHRDPMAVARAAGHTITTCLRVYAHDFEKADRNWSLKASIAKARFVVNRKYPLSSPLDGEV